LVAVYFFRQDLAFPRSIFLVFGALNAALVAAWRLGSRTLVGSYPRRRVLVVGTNAAAAEVIDTIRVQHWLGMDIVGAVAGDGVGSAASATKRVFDVCIGALLLVVALPVLLLVGLAIRLTSRGPVLFRQQRVGKDRRAFTMIKFRTMQVDAERGTGPVLASE